MTDLTLRAVSDANDFDAFMAASYAVFLQDPQKDEIDLLRAFTEYDRMFGFHDGTHWVSTAGAFGKQVVLPGGGLVPVAAVTMVTVSPSHRRRGLLTAMMRHQLEDVRARGTEALAMLFASEASIYGRFGYGMAISDAGFSGRVRELGFRPDVELGDGSVTHVDVETFMASAPEIQQRAMMLRPGLMERPRAWWDNWIHDSEERRKESGKIRFLLHREADGTATGFAIYRPKNSWTDRGQPNSELQVREVRATNHRAYAQIWRYLLDMDLVRSVWYDGAVDEPLRALVADQRALACQVIDGVYVRLVDVPRALTLRKYAAPVDVVLDVADEFCPWNTGRWHLRGGPDGADCETTTAPADIAISVRDLGASYLGGVSLQALANAGLVEERTPGSVHRAAVAFGWPVAPGIPDNF